MEQPATLVTDHRWRAYHRSERRHHLECGYMNCRRLKADHHYTPKRTRWPDPT